jgi:hypothetical protein
MSRSVAFVGDSTHAVVVRRVEELVEQIRKQPRQRVVLELRGLAQAEQKAFEEELFQATRYLGWAESAVGACVALAAFAVIDGVALARVSSGWFAASGLLAFFAGGALGKALGVRRARQRVKYLIREIQITARRRRLRAPRMSS